MKAFKDLKVGEVFLAIDENGLYKFYRKTGVYSACVDFPGHETPAIFDSDAGVLPESQWSAKFKQQWSKGEKRGIK